MNQCPAWEAQPTSHQLGGKLNYLKKKKKKKKKKSVKSVLPPFLKKESILKVYSLWPFLEVDW